MITRDSSDNYSMLAIRVVFEINGHEWEFDHWEYEIENIPAVPGEVLGGLVQRIWEETQITLVGKLEGVTYTWRFGKEYAMKAYEQLAQDSIFREYRIGFVPNDVKFLAAAIVERRDWHFNWRMQYGMRYDSGKDYILSSGIS